MHVLIYYMLCCLSQSVILEMDVFSALVVLILIVEYQYCRACYKDDLQVAILIVTVYTKI